MKLEGKIEPKPGVYMIKNTVNGKVYIGSSVNVWRRANQHRNYLNKKSHKNLYLQNAYDKYGASSFVFTVLTYCESPDIREIERNYISEHHSTDKKCGYNLSDLTENGRLTHLKETRKTISRKIKETLSRLTPEERSIRAKRTWENKSPEERSAIAKKGLANIPPEKRSEMSRQKWENLSSDRKKRVIERANAATRKKVICSNGMVFSSQSEAARHFNVRQSLIHRAVTNGKCYEKLNNLSFSYCKEVVNETSF